MEKLPSLQGDVEIIDDISNRKRRLEISGDIRFSRGPARYSRSLFEYDELTETLSKTMIFSQIGMQTLERRLNDVMYGGGSFSWPQHVPYRILEGLDFGGRENVFAAFPYAFGVDDCAFEESVAVELVEFTEQIATRIVFPGTRLVFDNSNEIMHELARIPTSCAIYIYGAFHEIGHYIGEYSLDKVETRKSFLNLTASEICADLISFYLVREIRPALLLQTLMRLFWYLPKGDYDSDPDVIASYYFIEILIEGGALKILDSHVSLDLDSFVRVLSNLPRTERVATFLHAGPKSHTRYAASAFIDRSQNLPKDLV